MAKLSFGDLPAGFMDVLPQSAVQATIFPKGTPQNSIWDFVRTSDGRFFVALCAEGNISSAGQLHEYLPRERAFRFCFDLQKECMITSRQIPPSKIHTSACALPDGRIIMATHNTAPAPGHPFWLYDAYYSHMWEGFPGSHLLMYDPATNVVRNLGVPIPRESIYGGIYDPKHHVYYAIGFGRGHLYRHDLTTGQTVDMGQVAELGAFRLTHGPDGNIYGSTRSGWLYKIDVDKQEVVDLGVRLPGRPDVVARNHYAFGASGPDGRLYMANHVSDLLAALDVKTGRLEVLGSSDPGPIDKRNYPRCPSGLVFDDRGVLWYATIGGAEGHMGLWAHLARWDITRGGQPERMGLLGTPERTVWYCSEMILHDNVLYATDTNHLEDPPGILRIDLAALEAAQDQPRQQGHDPMAYGILADAEEAYPGDVADLGPFRALQQSGKEGGEFGAKNTYTIQAADAVVFRLWQKVPAAESSVVKLQWLDDQTLRGVCGTRASRAFTCSTDGSLTILPESQGKATAAAIPDPTGLTTMPETVRSVTLPHRQGRQYLATPACAAPWRGGQWLVGTEDGLLARVDPAAGTAFALGAVAPHGPVHQIVTNAAGTIAYGVAGDESDLGSCFRYDDVQGLWELGRTYTYESSKAGVACSCQPVCLALSPDETRLAIGAADRLGTVYVYRDLK
ncbi:MAG: hypothetical protein NT031_00665 [Planctomycetota bacterium]|nr:hypothetical protein [Planctomycetota bacterium]